jgi:hypothetical protein
MSSLHTTVYLSTILLLALIPGRGCFFRGKLDAPALPLETVARGLPLRHSIIALILNVVAFSHILVSNRWIYNGSNIGVSCRLQEATSIY